jgi:putative DNA primase/helicase
MMQRATDAKAASPDIADLRGLRLVTSSETEEGQRLAEAKVKYLTGMNTVKARRLYEDGWEFKPTWKLWIDCNHLPNVRGGDKAIWTRLKKIPFELSLSDEQIDRALPAKLAKELPGILRWCIDGCLAWRREGLAAPEEVAAATKTYHSQMDVIGRFLDDATEGGLPTNEVAARHLYRAYQIWATASGEFVLSERVFGERMADRGFQKHRTAKGYFYRGLRLRFAIEEYQSMQGMYGHTLVSSKVPENSLYRENLPETQNDHACHTSNPEEDLVI